MDPIVQAGIDGLKRLATRVVAAGVEEVAGTVEEALDAGRARVQRVRSNAKRIRARVSGAYANDPYGFERSR
jgi:hypothetical protein